MIEIESNIVYAVVDRPGRISVEPIKVRVSEPLDWSEAQDRWADLDAIRRALLRVPAGLTAARMPVRFFCVRVADDPEWPADAPLSTTRIEAATV